jgi:zinc protease
MVPRRLLALAATLFTSAAIGQTLTAQSPARASQPGRATKVASVEGVDEYTLPNGLRVLLFPDQSKATTTVNITYLVGSRHEGSGETGMAHLLEHLLFKGSKNHTNIPQELTQHGSRPNGTTWYDRTNYFETVPSADNHIEWALDLEADRMVTSFIAKKDLESEFSVVRNELESGENSPFAVTLQRMLSTAYLWHGYGKSTIGTRSDVENVPIERLQACYKRYYQPDNAVLVVAGKFDPVKTLALVEKKFGAIPKPQRTFAAGNLLFPTYTIEPTQDGEREVVIRRTGDAQLLMLGYHIPAGSHADFAAVDVLSSVLGNNPSGRLYKALIDAKLASSVGSNRFQFREPGMLWAQAQLRMSQSIDSARTALELALDQSAKSAFTTEEVERAKTALLKNIELTLSNSEYVGYGLTEWAAMGDWRLMFLHRDRIAKVTAADVQRVAAAYLKSSNRTVAMFIPSAQPDRAEIPAIPNVRALVADYKGHAVVQAGEAFDASTKNIEGRTERSTLPNGMHVTLLRKQTRAGKVVAQITLRHGTVPSLTGKSMTGSFALALLSRGTTQLTRQQVKDSLDKLKAQVFIGGATNSAIVSIETTREFLIPTTTPLAALRRAGIREPAP